MLVCGVEPAPTGADQHLKRDYMGQLQGRRHTQHRDNVCTTQCVMLQWLMCGGRVRSSPCATACCAAAANALPAAPCAAAALDFAVVEVSCASNKVSNGACTARRRACAEHRDQSSCARLLLRTVARNYNVNDDRKAAECTKVL